MMSTVDDPEGEEMIEGIGGVIFQRADDHSDNSGIWDDTALIKAYDEAVSKAKCGLPNGDVGGSSDQQSTGKSRKSRRKQRKKKSSKEQINWRNGDICQCMFSEDQLLYMARIISINTGEGTCVVRYCGYGNEEAKQLSDLIPADQNDSFSQQDMCTVSESENSMDWVGHSPAQSSGNHGKKAKKKQHERQPGKLNSSSFRFPMMSPPYGNATGQPTTMFPPWGPQYPISHTRAPFVPPPPPPMTDDISDLDNEALCSMLMAWYMSGYHTGYYQGLRDGKKAQNSDLR